MNCATIQSQPRKEPITKGGIHIDAANRIEALLWKLRIRLLFIGVDIATG